MHIDLPGFSDHAEDPEPRYRPKVPDWAREITKGEERARRLAQGIGLNPPIEDDEEDSPELLDVPPAGYARPTAEEAAEEAARDALAEVIAEPITDLVMLGTSLFAPGSENAVAGEEVDDLIEGLMDVADPARLPSEIADKVISHFTAHLLASALGPVGPVVAICAGKFAGELTRQALDGGEDTSDAVSAIEVAGAFADEQLGRLADSEPFRDYISDLMGSSIAEILPKGEEEGQESSITAVVAVYEARSPEGDPTTVWIRPASFAVWTCIPATPVVTRPLISEHDRAVHARRRKEGEDRAKD